MKALVVAFNQGMALMGAFSVVCNYEIFANLRLQLHKWRCKQMISTRSLDVANVWRVTGGRWNAGAGGAQWARGRVARLHTKQPHLVTLCPPSARRWESIRTRQSHGAARPQLCRVCSVFVVCHQRFQRGTEQRRTGGGGGGMVCAGGHCAG